MSIRGNPPSPGVASRALALAALGALVAGAILGGGWAPATAAPGGDVSPLRTLVVTGQARVTARPDTAVVSVGVDVQADTARAAQSRNSATVRRVLDAVRALGLPEQDMQTSGVDLSPVWRYDEKSHEQVLVGYRAAYTLRVSVADMQKVGDVLDAAVQAGANRVDGVTFTVRDVDELKKRAITQAVQDGMTQARTLAEAARIELGPLQSIADVSFEAPPPPTVRALGARVAMDMATSTPVQPGSLEFSANATLTFIIQP